MAKKSFNEKERELKQQLIAAAFTMPVPTVKDVAEKRREVSDLQKELDQQTMLAGVGRNDPKRSEQLVKDLERSRLELDGMEYTYFSQGIIPIDKDDDPEIQQMTRLENQMKHLELENEIQLYNISQGYSQNYSQYDENISKIRNLKREFHAMEAQYYGPQGMSQNEREILTPEQLKQREGKIDIKPLQDKQYMMTVVVGGQAYSGKMDERQHDKLMALNDTQKLNYIATLIPAARIKEQGPIIKASLLESAKEALYNLPKPEVYASAPQQQEKQAYQQTSGAALAAANFEEVTQQETAERSQGRGMGL